MTGQRLTGKIQTVLGQVEPGDLGLTITHEHLLFHARHIAKEPADRSMQALFRAPVRLEMLGRLRFGRLINDDNCRLTDTETAIAEANLFKAAGGGTIVDATSIGIGRDPAGLARIARATGLHIVMGSSYYVEETHPPDHRIDEKSEAEIAEAICHDILEGADDSSVRAGIIGEVGCSWPLTDRERKVLRASARAQRMTGAALMVHPGRDQTAPLGIIAILDKAGADLSRTIMCHVDRTVDRPDILARLAASGCVLEYDLFGFEHSYYPWSLPVDMPNDAARLRWLQWLIERGHREQILMSHDICFKDKLARYGGHGYAHILQNVIPLMREKNFSNEDIDSILVQNPKRLLAFV